MLLLDNVSPYGSRRVTVEYDGSTTAAYLRSDDGIVSATWIANHVPAPPEVDEARLERGHVPLMPAGRTRSPSGRPPLEAADLSALWFEEGDGVAILEDGRPLAVIPGWCDISRGLPGYSRDVIGQTPFGWSLEDAMPGLAPRIERAGSFWRWRHSPGGWAQFQQAALEHLNARLGPAGPYVEAPPGRHPLIGISQRQWPGAAITLLSTVGMSCQRMPVVEQVLDEPSRYLRVELAVGIAAVGGPQPDAAIRVLSWLASYPWQAITWLGPGHSVRWPSGSVPFPLGAAYSAVLLLDGATAGSLPGPETPDLSGFAFGGDPVRWLWLVPITESERLLAKSRGSAEVVRRLAATQRPWLV